MELLQGYLEVLFKALILLGLSLSVGGTGFAILVMGQLRAWKPFSTEASRRTIAAVAVGAAMAAFFQLAFLSLEPLAFAAEYGPWPLAAFMETAFARAGLFRAFLAFCLALLSRRLLRRPESRLLWILAGLTAMFVALSGAWLVHGVSRLENVVLLMTATAIHQAAAVLWVGGVIQCILLRGVMQKAQREENAWPLLLSRFSPLALSMVLTMVGSGILLAYYYIGDIGGVVGTAYGTMVATKIALLGVALCLGGLNNIIVRRWKKTGRPGEIQSHVPPMAEAEAATGMVVLFAAASLTSQPPAVDVIAERATPAEVLYVFTPKMPQLVPPDFQKMLANAASSLDPFAVSGTLDRIQSNFNHNISGIFVLAAGFLALLQSAAKVRWARFWPLSFLLLGLFILVLGEPNGWPLGNEGFWETLVAPGVFQHRLATLLVICLALGEMRVQAGSLAHAAWRFGFPILCFFGGSILLTHAHSVFAGKWAFLIEVSHNAIGFLAVALGVARWLDLRLPIDERRLPSLLWPLCLMLIGLVLLFYREV